MGQSESVPVPSKVNEALKKSQSEEKLMRRVKARTQSFAMRSGGNEICSTLSASFEENEDVLKKSWIALSPNGRRELILEVRRLVLKRARTLHEVIAGSMNREVDKSKVISKLMQKCATEIYDTDWLVSECI